MKVSHETGTRTIGAPGVAGQLPRLLDQVRERMRRLSLARRAEEAYVSWIRRFIVSQGKRHPRAGGVIDKIPPGV